ncbi:hypothetical protein PFTANZ_03667 [Plasmodium falciparum Tanzania (2000708)]|uniref:Uncharacterized protein n=1 Tax=Plasmodium falciparum Tanzania (2000708) TaxID=1036725 RepID=A0A024W4X5_PLAFA|nr:hypothetical protein PFTANZ_03667 [Plasmodium falciparum Tanzania (2000708)]
MNNIDYIEDGPDLDELLKKISATYKECNKYDKYIEKDEEYIEDDDIEEEKINDKKKKNSSNNYYNKNEYPLNNNMNKYSYDNNKNLNVIKNKKVETFKKIDDIKNIIINEKKRKNSSTHGHIKNKNDNILRHLNVRRKRIVQSSDESDEIEKGTSKKSIIKYSKKRKSTK